MNIKSFFLGALLFFPALSHAAVEVQRQEDFLQELEAAKYALTFKYCPTEWKAEYIQWDLDAAFEEAKARMIERNCQTISEYQKIYREFFGSLQDYHVGALFYSSEWSAFPIVVKSVNGRYFITDFQFQVSMRFVNPAFGIDEIDVEKVESELSKCQIGDEILEINGTPIQTVIEQLIDDELYGNRTPTGYALAERMLFTRYGMRGHTVPKGDFTLTVNPLRGRRHTMNLSWIHVKEWVTDPHIKEKKAEPATVWHQMEACLMKDFSVSLAKDLLRSPFARMKACDDDNDHDDEDLDWREKSFVPSLGKILWETDEESDFYAYQYLDKKGRNIGYLYIPDFSAAGPIADNFMAQWISIMQRFEQETDALVVDINDNPGGNLFYMYGILALLADKPLETPTHTEVLVQEDIFNMATFYNLLKPILEGNEDDVFEEATLGGYPVNKASLQKIVDYTKSLLDQWNAGLKRTSPDYIFGLDVIEPHPEVHYTKPILVLTNELDFSCGDFFPAVLQDNRRATLFGKKTAGAGGYVRAYPQVSQFGVMFYSLTGSLAYRVDGNVIENLGVSPDVPYDMTSRDLQHGFLDYVDAVNHQIDLLLK